MRSVFLANMVAAKFLALPGKSRHKLLRAHSPKELRWLFACLVEADCW